MKNKKYIPDEDYDYANNNAPLLSGIGKKNPFKVPENYFEEATDLIIQQTKKNDKITSRKPAAGIKRLYYTGAIIAAAASILLFILLMTPSDNSNDYDFYLTDLYIDMYDDDSETLFDQLSSLSAEEIFVDGYEDENFTSDDMIDYLMDEDYEIDLLYEY